MHRDDAVDWRLILNMALDNWLDTTTVVTGETIQAFLDSIGYKIVKSE